MPPKLEPTLLDKLLEQRATRVDEWSADINAFEEQRGVFETRLAEADETKRPTEEERNAFDVAKATFIADCDQRQAEIQEFDRRIADQKEIVRRRQEAADAHKDVVTDGDISEPMTYRRDNGRGMNGVSYFRDLACSMVDGASFSSTTKSQSIERLDRHRAEMEVEVPKRIAAAEERARRKVALAESRGATDEPMYDPFHRGAVYNPVEKRVEPNRTDGYGGFQEMAAA
jgi:hypothetical protein